MSSVVEPGNLTPMAPTPPDQITIAPVEVRVTEESVARESVFTIRDLAVRFGSFTAISGVSLDIPERAITAFIGPSGCGKTTVLRSLNRMHDLTPSAAVSGEVRYRGIDLYGAGIDAAEVRHRIGMVFQKPNPFPKSIFDNVAYGLRISGFSTSECADRVEHALRRAALWDEVQDKLKQSALGLSGGQQQRLCIARALAVEPDVLLMDEPCSALDPIATGRIEDLMGELKQDLTIVIVTHNMQQAARVSDRTAFFTAEDVDGARRGVLVEVAPTQQLFTNPADPRTEGYITGRFG